MAQVLTDKRARILDCGAGTGIVGEEVSVNYGEGVTHDEC